MVSDPDVRRRLLIRAGLAAPAGMVLAACSSGPATAAPTTASGATPASPTAAASSSTAASASASTSASGSASTGPLRPRLSRTIATGLDVPWSIVFLPTGVALVSQRDTGVIARVSASGRVRTVGTVPGVLSNVDHGGEAGLLGLALAPDFAASGWLYAYHTAADGNRVVWMRYRGGILGSPHTILTGIASSIHHNGGGLAFGPDGHLFVSTGDAEDAASAQDRTSLNGKILRLTADGRVPSGNPFGNEVWTYGHRNVEGLAFDDRGQLWASEFGDKAADELNLIVKGGNYGWPFVEGRSSNPSYRNPLATWPTSACSPSGIAITRGRAWLGALQGQCVYSVVLSGSDAGRVQRYLTGTHGRLRSVAVAPDGSLWVGTSNRDGRATPSAGDDRLLRVALA